MNNIWYDKVVPDPSHSFIPARIGMSVLSFGLLAPILLTSRESKVSSEFINEKYGI